MQCCEQKQYVEGNEMTKEFIRPEAGSLSFNYRLKRRGGPSRATTSVSPRESCATLISASR